MIKTIYEDQNSSQLIFYVNANDKLCLECGALWDDDSYYRGLIVLEKEDVSDIIERLQEMIKQMK